MATIKPSKNWYVDFKFNHQRFRKKSPVNTKAGAKSYEATLKSKLARGESIDFDESEKIKIPTLAEFYTTWYNSYVKTNNKPSTRESKKSIFKIIKGYIIASIIKHYWLIINWKY